MSTALRIFLTLAGATVLAALAALSVGTIRMHQSTARAVRRLLDGAAGDPSRPRPSRPWHGLPEPVARYFGRALPAGPIPPRAARIVQRGRFRVGGRSCPLVAVQHLAADPPGFVWDASIALAPLVSIRVRDSYLRGEADMSARLLATVRLVERRGDEELARGALQRYLAEAVWFPPALLPQAGVHWTARDSSSAIASIADGPHIASVEFQFDAAGDVVGVVAPDRPRFVAGDYVPTPWRCRFADHAERNGMRIPLSGRAAWRLPGGEVEYWTGRIVEAELNPGVEPAAV
jgi:hypothetical protein